MKREKEFLEKETKSKFALQEQTLNVIYKDLDSFEFRIKEKELLSNQMFLHYKGINEKLKLNESSILNLKKQLADILQQKNEIAKKIKSLENSTYTKKNSNMSQIEQFKKITKENEGLTYQLQMENEEIYKLTKIKESINKNIQFNKEIHSNSYSEVKDAEDQAAIASLSLEVHRLEHILFEKKNNRSNNTLKDLEEKLERKLNKKKNIEKEIETIKSNIEELKNVIKQYRNNYKTLKTYVKDLDFKEDKMDLYFIRKRKFKQELQNTITILQSNE